MKASRFVLAGFVLATARLLSVSASAETILAPPFTDHAVLQRDTAVPVWGWDSPAGATVTITYGGQTKETRVNQSGLWRADFDPMPARAEGMDLVVKGSSTLTLHDVVVGEVWLASGQSNMEWTLDHSRGYDVEKARPANPLIRHLRIEHSPADLPVTKVQTSGWMSAAPENIGYFTGVGYFFARSLAEKIKVPVGIIHTSWGGTPVESWLPEPVLRTTQAWPGFAVRWQAALKVFPQKLADQPGLEAAWHQAQEELRSTGKPITMQWPRPPMAPGSAYGPGFLFNGMIAPLAPYALRGALWYQGESNVGHPREYRELFTAMIKAWRATWLQGDFPFLFVQLPNYDDHNPTGRGWAELREAQEAALALPAAGMAVTIDVGEATNLHPTDKRPVGERLALIAAAQIHDQRLEWSGPVVQSVAPEGAALRVRFSHAAGLTARADPISGFEIAGADWVFRAASALIDGETVLVSAPEVPAPLAVRYAFINAPAASLFNSAGLPAGPFRTDDW